MSRVNSLKISLLLWVAISWGSSIYRLSEYLMLLQSRTKICINRAKLVYKRSVTSVERFYLITSVERFYLITSVERFYLLTVPNKDRCPYLLVYLKKTYEKKEDTRKYRLLHNKCKHKRNEGLKKRIRREKVFEDFKLLWFW